MTQTDRRWGTQDVVLLKQLRADGRSNAVIAAAMGKAKSAVSGKISRLELPLARMLSKTCQEAPMPVPSILPANPSLPPISFLGLTPLHCRAMLDERDPSGVALFCGAPQQHRSSYCPFHHDLFHRPLTPRED